MAKSPPSFDFYFNDWIGGTRRMNHVQRACYLELLIDQWQNGSIPDSHEERMRVCGITSADEWRGIWERIGEKFEYHDDEHGQRVLVNPRMARDRSTKLPAYQRRLDVARENGSRGGRPPKPKPNPLGFGVFDDDPQTGPKPPFGEEMPETPKTRGKLPEKNPNETQRVLKTKPKQNPQGKGEGGRGKGVGGEGERGTGDGGPFDRYFDANGWSPVARAKFREWIDHLERTNGRAPNELQLANQLQILAGYDESARVAILTRSIAGGSRGSLYVMDGARGSTAGTTRHGNPVGWKAQI